MHVTIRAWAAYAPGLETRAAWESWAQQPYLPTGDAAPALPAVAPQMRRRLTPLGRMAVHVATACRTGGVPLPSIFASRHGDASRACGLLQELGRSALLSPTDFSLSVHNAVAALYSMAGADSSPYTALAAGEAGAEAALVEAAGMLADGIPEVLVVVYEAPLPAVWQTFADTPQASFAWAWRVALAASGDRNTYVLQSAAAPDAVLQRSSLPHALEVLHFVLGDKAELTFTQDRCVWRWRRHA